MPTAGPSATVSAGASARTINSKRPGDRTAPAARTVAASRLWWLSSPALDAIVGLNSDQSKMKTLPISTAKAKLAELVDVVARRDEAIEITRNGQPVAMIVSKDEYDSWRETL